MSEAPVIAARKPAGEPAPPRSRGRPSSRLSEQITAEILVTASALFVEAGYEKTSMEAVATALGIPKTTLYKRFPDKSALLRAVVEDMLTRLSQSRSRGHDRPDATLADRLVRHVTTLLVWATRPEVRTINRLASHLPDTPEFAVPGVKLWGYRSMHALLASLIVEHGPAAGIHAAEPDEIAGMIMALVAGTVALRVDPAPLTIEEATPLARAMTERLLRGAAAW